MKHEESISQRSMVKWFRYQYPDYVLMSVPNGGNRGKIEAAIMKAEGTYAGAGDLFLMLAAQGYHGLWLEVKTAIGKQSDAQKEFEKKCNKSKYKYVIVRSFDEFKNEIDSYILN